MARLIVTIGARTDIRRIIDYLEENAGKPVALRYAVDFDAAIDRIAELPGVGSPRRQFGEEMRIVIVNPYLVFYERLVANDTVVVLRVLDGRRKITEDLLRSERRRP